MGCALTVTEGDTVKSLGTADPFQGREWNLLLQKRGSRAELAPTEEAELLQKTSSLIANC